MFEPPRWYEIASFFGCGPATLLLGLLLDKIGLRGAPVFAVGVVLTMPNMALLWWKAPWLVVLLAAAFPLWAI